MGLTSEVDSKILYECFELGSYDNLLKPEYMNAINKRREHLLDDTRKLAEDERIIELKRLKEETMKCNIISQRVAFQEFCKAKKVEIMEEIEKYTSNEEEAKNIKKPEAEEMMGRWFNDFKIAQPNEYFLEHPTDDSDLCSNIQSTNEFLLYTLEIFDLPKGYMEGKGHFPDFGKAKDNKSAAAKM